MLKPLTSRLVRYLSYVPLRYLLVVCFTVQILIVVSAVGWLSFHSNQQTVHALVSRLQQETSDRITQELTTHLAEPVTVSKLNLDAIQLGLVDVQNSTQLEQLFWRELRTHKVSLIKLVTESGRLVGVGNLVPGENSRVFEVTPEQPERLRVYATDRQGNRTALVQTILERNLVYRLWYTKAVQAGRLVWSAINQVEGYPTIAVITCSAPIYNQASKLIGVLAAELTLSDLSNFLRTVKTGTSSRTFIVDHYGLLVASSDNQPIIRTVGSVASRLHATDSSDRLIQTTAHYLSRQFPDFTAITTRQHLTFSDKGQKRFVQVTPWHDELGLDWLVVNVLPEADFMGQVNTARAQTLWLCLLALGATIVVGSFTARWIVYPIMRLSRSAEALSVGDWQTPVDIWRNDEVGHLAKAFQRMAYQLQDSFALLEQRVEEQTADLATAEIMNRILLQAIPDLIARLDNQGTYLDFKPAETFSSVVTQHEVVGFNIYDLLPPELAEQHMQGVRQALRTGELQHQEYKLIVKGDVRYEESRIVPIGSDQALVMVRDITERKQAEKEMEILLTLTQGVNASTDFQTALTITLKEICDVTGWLCGEAWVPTTDGQALECHPAWYLNEAVSDEQQVLALQAFRYYSEGLTLVANQGLPTQVWQQCCAIWITDIEMDPKALYLRESVASDCGLKAGAGFPILTQQGQVVAVLVFWIGHTQHYISAAMNLVNTVTAQLGTVLYNKQIEAKLAGLFAAMRDVILIFDDQGYCLEAVATDPNLLYLPSEQQVGHYLNDVLPKEQATAFRECIWEALRTHQTTTIEYKLPVRGQDLWFSANVSPIADDRVIWVARDITHRKQAEEVLRQREADLARTSRFLDSIIETMPLAVFAKDVTQEFRYVLWNRAAEEIYGIRREQVLGRTLYDLVDAELAAQLSAEHEALIEQRQLVITDEIFQSRYQREIWQRIRKLPIVDDQDQVSHLLYIAEDVTEYKRLEAELHATNNVLRQAEEKYRSIVENAVDGIFQTTPDGHYLSANLALAKIFGYDSPEELMAAVNQIVHHLYVDKRDRDRFVTSISLTGAITNFEAKAYRKDGSTIWIEENAREVRDADGKLLYYEGIVTDITRRRMAETALRLEKEKSERLLLNILPEPIVNRLKHSNGAIAESFEEVSILFADIVGFTPLSTQMQPIELVGMLNQVFSEFDRLVDQLQLEKIKTIGDAYMVAAGLPIPREDHAEAIAELALTMQAAIQHFYTIAGDPIYIRIGINSGAVVAGVIGTKKFIYDLWGDTVNVANRMESYGEPGKIQVTEATYMRLRDRYHLVQRGCIPIKGKGEMTTYWLQGRATQ